MLSGLLLGCASQSSLKEPITPYQLTEANIIAVETAVRKPLKDPNSAQFQNLQSTRQGASVMVCGSVNAKNSYGGYTGFRPFWVKLNPELNYATLMNWVVDDQNFMAPVILRSQCRSAGMLIE